MQISGMRLAPLFLALMTLPVAAQELPETGIWKVETGTQKRAATIEYTQSDTLSYGFSCWKGHWLFFFNYQAPEGGKCENYEACENDVAEVELTFQVPQRPDTSDQFTLFENYYFQDQMLNVLDIGAMIKAGRFRLALNDRLKTIWQRDGIDFSLDGFKQAVENNQKVFSCPIVAPLPIPPEKIIVADSSKTAKAVAQKSKGKKLKKSKAARARAAKSKLPSHALKGKKPAIRKKRR